MHRQKGFAPILIVVGILVIIVISGGAYYFGKFQALKSPLQNPTITSQTPKPTINFSEQSQAENSRISEAQAIEIAKKATSVTTTIRTRALVVDHRKYGNVWEVDLFLNESSTMISGKTVLVNTENGSIIGIYDLSILP